MGVCTKITDPRSYEVKVGNTTYRRNQQQLILLKTKQQGWSPDQIEEFPQPMCKDQYPDTPSSVDNNSASNTMPEDNTMMSQR